MKPDSVCGLIFSMVSVPFGEFYMVIACSGGRLCPSSKFVDFSWLFVGADAHLGAKRRALRGCASKLACGRRIGPLKCFEFALDFHKTGHFLRADRVVRPYDAKSQFHECAGKPP